MKLKKFLSLILALTMLLTAVSISACTKAKDDDSTDNGSADNSGGAKPEDNKGNSENTYTVYVKNESGSGIAGVDVLIFDDSFSINKQVKTGADGSASIELDASDKVLYAALLGAAPEGYLTNDSEYEFDSNKTATITLAVAQSNKATYRVTVVDEDGNGVSGVALQLCSAGEGAVCITFDPTDENGVTEKAITAGEMHVKLLTVPDGFSMPDADSDGYHATINESETAVTITLTRS